MIQFQLANLASHLPLKQVVNLIFAIPDHVLQKLKNKKTKNNW